MDRAKRKSVVAFTPASYGLRLKPSSARNSINCRRRRAFAASSEAVMFLAVPS
jgi:hypothetical protein